MGGAVFMRPEQVPADCTHFVTERTDGLDRVCEYVQPQWVYDSVNKEKLLPAAKYRPGVTLPPHLSPWDAAEPDSEDEDVERQEKVELVKSVLSRKQRSELKRLEIKGRDKKELERQVRQKRKVARQPQ